MTTILVIKTKEGVLIGADSQVTSGNLRLPSLYSKVKRLGENILIGSSGSVGLIQNLIKIAERELKVNKVLLNQNPFDISPQEFSEMLSDLNFKMPLEYKSFQSSEFMIIGYDGQSTQAFLVGSEGSNIPVHNFYAIGSGSEFALSIISSVYNENLTLKEATNLIITALGESTKLDVYTNSNLNIAGFYSNGDYFELQPKAESVEPIKEELVK